MRRFLPEWGILLLSITLTGCAVTTPTHQAIPARSEAPMQQVVQPVAVSHKPDQAALDKALLDAVRIGEDTKVSELLTQGANPNAKDANGQYALSLAAEAPVRSRIFGMGVNGICQQVIKHQGYEGSA